MGKKKRTFMIPLILVGGSLGCLCLLLVLVGGFAMYWYGIRHSEATPAMAKTVPDVPRDEPAAVAPAAADPAPSAPLPVQSSQPREALAAPKDPIQPVQQGERGELPLRELKAASVYIKAMTAALGATGSGFVIRAQGDTVYVVTNHHVVFPSKQTAGQPQIVFPPRMVPFPPISPRRPIVPVVPRRPRRGIAAVFPAGQQAAEITVVFHSGTAKEQSLPAEIVGKHAGDDLAVLKATGVRDVPRPIATARTPQLEETMPVLAFGFPFGEKLDPGKKNPAVTVTKGAVSSLREKNGELEDVQLDLDLNPGNSGGPVVDEKGALIGVAVAKVSNTRIGFAVPVLKLNRLTQGHIDPPASIQAMTTEGHTQVRILAPAVDPLGMLRAPTLLYGSADELQMPRQGPEGWKKLTGAKSSELTIRGAEAAAALDLSPPAQGALKILAQVSYQTESGRTVYGEPRTLSLVASAGPPSSSNPTTPAKPEDEKDTASKELKKPEVNGQTALSPSLFRLAVATELKKLEGNWQMVSEPKRLIIEDGVASLYFGNLKKEGYKLSVNPSANPKTIDLIDGDNVSLGIYRLSENGNELEICRGEWGGKKRPTKFSTKPGVGSGNCLHVFKREKDGGVASSKPATADDKDAAKKVLKKLEGNWQMVSGDWDAENKRLIIEDGVASLFFGNSRKEGYRLSVNPNANPKTIDLDEGNNNVSLGIYRLSEDGNELEICRGEWGSNKRPTKFSTKPGMGSGRFLHGFKRETGGDAPSSKPAKVADNDAAKKALKQLEGNWQMVSEPKRLIIEDGVASLYFGNQRQDYFKLSVDPSANPKTIDFIGGDKRSLGIYRLSEDGNQLEICRNEWGDKKRPTKFSTKPGVGSGGFMDVFKREKDDDAPSSKPAPPADKDAAKKALKQLEGNWQMVSGDLRADAKRLIIEDGVASLYFGNNKQQASKLSVNPNADPKTIDFIEGDKVSLAIYRLSEDGNELEICSAGWGAKKRPTKFSTKPGVGSGAFLNVYKREKE